jgi:hypothetical protein
MAWWLVGLTAVIVAGACLLYLLGHVGLAQFLLVAASGTAGASTVLFVERRR